MEDGRQCLPSGPYFLSHHLPGAQRLLPHDTLLLPPPDASPASHTTRMLIWMFCGTDATLPLYPLPLAVRTYLLATRRVVLWRRVLLTIGAAPAPPLDLLGHHCWRHRWGSGRRSFAAASYRWCQLQVVTQPRL